MDLVGGDKFKRKVIVIYRDVLQILGYTISAEKGILFDVEVV